MENQTIKKNEIRIGNLINHEIQGIIEINGIDPHCLDHSIRIKNGSWVYLKNCQPINLTNEWLLKLGFKPLVKDFYRKSLILHSRKRGFVVKKSIPVIESVHQLQNLNYALTGEELTRD